MDSITFVVLGLAVGKAARVVTRTGHTYLPSRTRDFMWQVQAEAAHVAPEAPWEGAVAVEIDSWRHPPKGWSRRKRENAIAGTVRPTSRPDCDNLSKCICDALSGLVFVDDAQVASLCVRKWFGLREQTTVRVTRLEEHDAGCAGCADRGSTPRLASEVGQTAVPSGTGSTPEVSR